MPQVNEFSWSFLISFYIFIFFITLLMNYFSFSNLYNNFLNKILLFTFCFVLF